MSKKLSISLIILIVVLMAGINSLWHTYRNPVLASRYTYEPCQSYAEWLSVELKLTETALPAITPIPPETPIVVAYPILILTSTPQTNPYPYTEPTVPPLLRTPPPVICTCQTEWQKLAFGNSGVSILYPPETKYSENEATHLSLKIPDCLIGTTGGRVSVSLSDSGGTSLESFLQAELSNDPTLRYREIWVNRRKGIEIYEKKCSFNVEVIFVEDHKIVQFSLSLPERGGKILDAPCETLEHPRPTAEQLGFFYTILNTIEFSTAP